MRAGIRLRSLVRLAMGVAVFTSAASAQRTGGPPSSGTGPGRAGGGSAPNMTGQPTGTVSNFPSSTNLYLTGNVMLDDGNPPPAPVTIERVCNGAPRAQGYTDQKGRFSFQIGQTSSVMQDASEDGGSLPGANRPVTGIAGGTNSPAQSPVARDAELANCDLRAVLAGFRSDTVTLGGRHLLDDPNVGTILLHRLANVEGSAISLTSLAAPKEARKAYERALQNIRKDKPAEAAKELGKAVEIYPDYAAAWCELGWIQLRGEEIAQARISLARAVAADPKFISPYAALAELEAKAENWAALAEVSAKLLKLDAEDYPIAYFFNATALLHLGQLDAAEKSARIGAKLDTPHRYPKLEQVLARILARKLDYVGAAAHLRSYLSWAPDAQDAAQVKKDLAEMERLSGANEQAKAAKAARQ